MNLLEQLLSIHEPRVDALRHAYARQLEGEIDAANVKPLAEAMRESADVVSAYYADNPTLAHHTTPAADTRMGVDTSWWDADGYYHSS